MIPSFHTRNYQSTVGLVQVFSEAMNRDDDPVSVAVTCIFRLDRDFGLITRFAGEDIGDKLRDIVSPEAAVFTTDRGLTNDFTDPLIQKIVAHVTAQLLESLTVVMFGKVVERILCDTGAGDKLQGITQRVLEFVLMVLSCNLGQVVDDQESPSTRVISCQPVGAAMKYVSSSSTMSPTLIDRTPWMYSKNWSRSVSGGL